MGWTAVRRSKPSDGRSATAPPGRGRGLSRSSRRLARDELSARRQLRLVLAAAASAAAVGVLVPAALAAWVNGPEAPAVALGVLAGGLGWRCRRMRERNRVGADSEARVGTRCKRF